MKSNKKKRVLAAVLCMVMVLSSNISALAGDEIFVDAPADTNELTSEPVEVFGAEPEVVVSDEAGGEPAPSQPEPTEPAPSQTEPTEPEASADTGADQTQTAPAETTADPTAADVFFSDGSDPVPETEPQNTADAPQSAEETVPTTETTPAAGQGEGNEDINSDITAEDGSGLDLGDGAGMNENLSAATELKQEFVDGEGNVVQRVTANLPVGAFAAETSDITMEVNYLDADSENRIKAMMNEQLPEGMQLGTYVFFDIQFKVKGEKAEALQPITITIEGSNLKITDTKRANVFYFDRAEAEGEQDKLQEIAQRSEVLESLQAAGQSTENIEDYDLSEITFREDGSTDKIILEGRKSTIYGCYVEEEKPAEEIETPEVPETPETPETEEPEINGEASGETEATEIEILLEEVNLRTEPDAEADNVAALAYAGDRFPLIETVTVGEEIWYKIQYVNPETGEASELYVRNDCAQIVEENIEVTDDETVELTEESGTTTELTYEDDKISVIVSAAEEGIIPEGAALQVTPITADSEGYANVEQKVQEKVAEEEKEVAGFLAYDITFVDPEGNELEPNGEVKVSMNYKPAAIPETVQETGAENTEVSVLHLEENAAGEVQQVVDMASANQVETLNTTEANEIQTVEMTTESFSVFTITWTYNRYYDPFTIKLHYVDENGKEINVRNKPDDFGLYDGRTVELEEYWREASDSGYTQHEIRVDSLNGDIITKLKASSSGRNNNNKKYYVKYLENGKKDWDSNYTDWLESSYNEKKEGDIYFIYKNDSSSGGTTGGGSSATGNLAHSKYVKDNEDGTYDLTLDVVGAVGTETNPAKVDIVFVLDLSGSMDDYVGYNKPRNLDKAKTAVQKLTTNLNANKTVDSQWKLVTFSNSAGVQTRNWVTATDINKTIQGFEYSDCDGGTNYEAGLTQAGSVLGTARKDSTKIVIFLTDGKPTFHGTNSQGGGDVTWLADYNGAITGAKTIKCDRFYSVGMGLESSLPIYEGGWFDDGQVLKYTSGLDLLTDVANATNCDEGNKQAINVGAGDSLDDVFSGIAGSITKYAASNVTITDRLTPEVDLVDFRGEVTEEPENLKVTVLNEQKWDVTRNEVEEGDIKALYDPDTKQITLDFADEYELKEDYTYSVTATIKPNDLAKEKYKENDYSYPDTGEKGTGKTSAGKKGIFSNVKDSAKVTWTTDDEVKEGKYNRPVVQIPEEDLPVPLKKEPVNFFLNLSSSILDTNGNIGGQSVDAFTTSVSGSFSEDAKNTQGIGVAINKDLRVIVPDDHNHESLTQGQRVYGVIGGTSATNAKDVDTKIRELGKENGTNGNQEGTQDEYYRIVNGSDEPAFPTDKEIFEYIKQYWDTPKTGVNKGKDITINGTPIDKDNLTTENFTIRWYVFKDQGNGEYWHIDGILVPKSGVLTITKTFPNQEVAEAVKDSFKIKVTGDFLGDSKNTTITKGLADAGNLNENGKPTENSDGTVTYQWDLAVFGAEYLIEEVGYETASDSKWKYKSTEWTYTDADGVVSEGQTTYSEVTTQRTAEDAETPRTQTFAFTNLYELANVSIDLKKFGTTYNNPLEGAEFELYTGSKNKYGSVTWEDTSKDTITVDNQRIELDLPEGYYKLKEVLAPSGYQLLEKEICFKIENRDVTLIDEKGQALRPGKTEMWKLEGNTSEGFVLSILNEALYSLPSTGGNGIFGYMIGGVAMMMAAMFILYKMRRKGVLRS